jgi:RimJ/RimL family protein N-acetyltransferase
MLLLHGPDIRRVRDLFEPEHLLLVVDAIVAGNARARIWVDGRTAPRSALIWDGAHCLYFAGSTDRASQWRELFDREITSRACGLLKAYITDDAADLVFADLPLQRRERVLYRRDSSAMPEWRRGVPPGLRISPINERFSELITLGNAADVVAEIESMWRSVEDFRRNGFGVVAHDAQAILCWCTAEHVSDGKCGIGIETVASHRGLGYATLAASAFVEHCVERGVTPYWDAWTSNAPSLAVAKKVGFRKVESYSVHVWDFDIASRSGQTDGGPTC